MGLRVTHPASLTQWTWIIFIVSLCLPPLASASPNGCDPNPCDLKRPCIAQGSKFACVCPLDSSNCTGTTATTATAAALWLDCGTSRVLLQLSAGLLTAPWAPRPGGPKAPQGPPRASNPACAARQERLATGTGTAISFRYDASQMCDAEIRDNGTHLWYVNKVVVGGDDGGGRGGRGGDFSITYSCPYPRRPTAQADYPIVIPASNTNTMLLGTTTVHLQVSLQDATLSVRLHLSWASGDDETLSSPPPPVLLVRDCWLGSLDISWANLYLMRHGCASHPAASLEVPNGRGPTVELRVATSDPLRWRPWPLPPAPLLLRCLVRVCRSAASRPACVADCPDSNVHGIVVQSEDAHDGILVYPPPSATTSDGGLIIPGISNSRVRDSVRSEATTQNPTGISKETDKRSLNGIPDLNPTGISKTDKRSLNGILDPNPTGISKTDIRSLNGIPDPNPTGISKTDKRSLNGIPDPNSMEISKTDNGIPDPNPTGISKETDIRSLNGIPDPNPTGISKTDERSLNGIPNPTGISKTNIRSLNGIPDLNPTAISKETDIRSLNGIPDPNLTGISKTDIRSLNGIPDPNPTGMSGGMSTSFGTHDHQENIGIPQQSPNPMGISGEPDKRQDFGIPNSTPPIAAGIPMGMSANPNPLSGGLPDQRHYQDELRIPDSSPNPPGMSQGTDEDRGGFGFPELSHPNLVGMSEEAYEAGILDSNPMKVAEGRGKRQDDYRIPEAGKSDGLEHPSGTSDHQDESGIPESSPNLAGISEEADSSYSHEEEFKSPESLHGNPTGMSDSAGHSPEAGGLWDGDDDGDDGDDDQGDWDAATDSPPVDGGGAGVPGIPERDGGDGDAAGATAVMTEESRPSEHPDPGGMVAQGDGGVDGDDGSGLGAAGPVPPEPEAGGRRRAPTGPPSAQGGTRRFGHKPRSGLLNVARGADLEQQQQQQQRHGLGGGCDPPCPDPQLCEPGPLGPLCICPHGLRKPHCKEADLRVQCGPDHIRVSLPMAYLAWYGVSPGEVSLGGSGCPGVVEQAGSSLAFYIEHGLDGSCGSRLEQTATHVTLWNELHAGHSTRHIDRTVFSLRFNCSYATHALVHLPFPVRPTLTVVDFGGQRGAFRLAMSLHNASTFTAAGAYGASPSLSTGDVLFVRLALDVVPGRRGHRLDDEVEDEVVDEVEDEVEDEVDEQVVEEVEEVRNRSDYRVRLLHGRPPGDEVEVAVASGGDEEEVAVASGGGDEEEVAVASGGEEVEVAVASGGGDEEEVAVASGGEEVAVASGGDEEEVAVASGGGDEEEVAVASAGGDDEEEEVAVASGGDEEEVAASDGGGEVGDGVMTSRKRRRRRTNEVEDEEEEEEEDDDEVVDEGVNSDVGERAGGWNLRLAARGCWATPTPNIQDNISHVFITRGCPSDRTLRFLSANGNSTQVLFRLRVFRFLSPAVRVLYLHCRVRVCAAASAGCEQSCGPAGRSGARQRRRAATDFEGVVSFGPIVRRPGPPSVTVLLRSRHGPHGALWFSLLGLSSLGIVGALVAIVRSAGICASRGRPRDEEDEEDDDEDEEDSSCRRPAT
ncbi:uncharacterized protein LOC142906694 isoform X3 [Petromyzon marinus]